jgi:uncharacterized delta-60 repeat protein
MFHSRKQRLEVAKNRRSIPQLESLEDRCLLSAGVLDPTFGAGGLVTTSLSQGTDSAYGVALQADGKIIAAGSANGQFGLARYGMNGALDSTFGNGGKVTTKLGAGATAWAVAIYASAGTVNDGKIVAAGTVGVGGSNNHGFGVVRYNRDGSLDKTFNKSGKAILDFSSGWDEARAVVIQPDGKIIAAGYSGLPNNNSAFTLVRFNVNGSLDTSFGSGGEVITDIVVGGSELILDIALQSDSKIVVAGKAPDPQFLGNHSFALARYNSNGSLDASFGAGGIVLNPTGTGYSDVAQAVMIQPDGRIVAAGRLQIEEAVQFGLMRFNTNGTLDSSFGTGGVAQGGGGSIFDSVLQPDGKIVAAGTAPATSGSGGAFALTRYNTDGSLDLAFGVGGRVLTDVAGTFEQFNGVALQVDGKIVAVGADVYDFVVARYLGDAPLLAASLPIDEQAPAITTAQAQPLLAEAIRRWTVADVDTSGLGSIDIRIANLGGTLLGTASGYTITLDDNAAGWGWFVDPTPWDDSESTTRGNQGERRRMDLLAVLMHELGHLLGHDQDEEGLMAETLTAGVRRTGLEHDDIRLTDRVFAQASDPGSFDGLGAWFSEQFEFTHTRPKRRK